MARSSAHRAPRTAEQAKSRGIGGDDKKPTQKKGRTPRSQTSPVAVDSPIADSDTFKLYIAYVHGHIPTKMIFSVFRKFSLGRLADGEDAVRLIPRQGRNAAASELLST